jgi:hypothetical protein
LSRPAVARRLPFVSYLLGLILILIIDDNHRVPRIINHPHLAFTDPISFPSSTKLSCHVLLIIIMDPRLTSSRVASIVVVIIILETSGHLFDLLW